MSIPYADIIVLALVAGFILLRLRSILGEDAGFDGKREDDTNNDTTVYDVSKEDTKVYPLNPSIASRIKAEEDTPNDKALVDALDESLQQSVADIKKIEPSFDLGHFINGAKGAFEMVLKAFHENDTETLKYLLADDIEDMFVEEAKRNEKAENRVHTTLVSIPVVEILDIDLRGKHATVDVKLVSEQITVQRNKEGEIVSGDPSNVQRIEDEWTFERDLGSKSPNWLVTAT